MNSGLPERRPRDGGRGRLRHFPRRAQPGHQAAGEEGEKNSRLIFFFKKRKSSIPTKPRNQFLHWKKIVATENAYFFG